MIPDTVEYAYRFVVESTRASQTVEGVDADALDGDAGSGSSDESSDEESDERQLAAIQTALAAARDLDRSGSVTGPQVRAINEGLKRAGLTQFGAMSLARQLARAKAKAERRKPPQKIRQLNTDKWLPAMIEALQEEETNFEKKRDAELAKAVAAAAMAAAVEDVWASAGNLLTHA